MSYTEDCITAIQHAKWGIAPAIAIFFTMMIGNAVIVDDSVSRNIREQWGSGAYINWGVGSGANIPACFTRSYDGFKLSGCMKDYFSTPQQDQTDYSSDQWNVYDIYK